VARNRRAKPSPGDIVITREAPMGEVCVVPDGLECCLGQRQVLLRPEPKKVNPRFLLYALQSPDVKQQIDWNEGTGSTVSNLRIPVLKALKIPTPDRSSQDGVAGLLGALDDRIDLLRQTNATLEAIAQALFKSWFVDFDPVRAKAEGREPEGMDPATAALFPSEFEESELGLIPKGWRAGTFGATAQLCKGTVNPLQSLTAEFDHYSLPAFDTGMMPAVELGEAIKSNKTPVPSNAVLISKLNPHIPRIWFVGDVRPNAVCSTEFLVWRPSMALPPEYIYCLASSAVFNSGMKQLVTGTSNSHQRVKPDHLRSMATSIPATEVAAAFGAIARPLMVRVLQNRSAVQTLTALRDTLLPRLISGKLRLSEAQAALEEGAA
jgi:type I restriction enzyme, S subunit